MTIYTHHQVKLAELMQITSLLWINGVKVSVINCHDAATGSDRIGVSTRFIKVIYNVSHNQEIPRHVAAFFWQLQTQLP